MGEVAQNKGRIRMRRGDLNFRPILRLIVLPLDIFRPSSAHFSTFQLLLDTKTVVNRPPVLVLYIVAMEANESKSEYLYNNNKL